MQKRGFYINLVAKRSSFRGPKFLVSCKSVIYPKRKTEISIQPRPRYLAEYMYMYMKIIKKKKSIEGGIGRPCMIKIEYEKLPDVTSLVGSK